MKVLCSRMLIFLWLTPMLALGQQSDPDCNHSTRINEIKKDLSNSQDHVFASELAQLFYRQLQYDSAILYQNLALEFSPTDSIHDYYKLSHQNYFINFPSADSVISTLASKYDSLHPFSAMTLTKKAKTLMQEGKYKSALPMLDRAVSILSAERDNFDKEYILAQIARVASLANTNQVDSAIIIGRQLNKHMSQSYEDCYYSRIQLLISMASRFDENEQIDSVFNYLLEAESLLDAYYQKYDPLYLLLYNELGQFHNAMGKSNLALETFIKAENIALAQVEFNRKLLSTVYSSIASIYRNLYNNQKALQYYNRSIQMLVEEYGDNGPLLFGPFANMGITLTSMKEYEEAAQYLDKALAYSLELVGEDHIYTAIVTGAVASNSSESGDYSKAEEYFNRSLKIRDELFGPASLRHANIYVNLSVMYRDMIQYYKAEKVLRNALQIYIRDHGEFHPEISGIYNRLGNLLVLQEKNSDAIRAFNLAIEAGKMDDTNSDMYDILTHLTILKNRSRAYLHLYKQNNEEEYLSLAQEDIENGTFLLEESLSRSMYTEAASELIGRYRDLFETGMDVFAQRYANKSDSLLIVPAWKMTDRSKSSSIRESLAEISSLQFQGLDTELLDEIRKTNQDLIAMVALRKRDMNDMASIATFDSTVIFQQNLDSLKVRFERTNPRYYEMLVSDQLVSLSEVQKELSPEEMILDYFLAEENLYVFSLSDSEFSFTSYSCSERRQDSIGLFVNGVSEFSGDFSQAISTWLYKTVSDNVSAGTKYVTIIPDGPLTYIPFEALQDENGSYLIEDYAISYAHSLSILNYQHQIQRKKGTQNFAGFAPIYQENSIDTAAQPQYAVLVRSGNLPLPSAQKEVREIKEIAGGQIFIGKEASKHNFIEIINEAKVAHLSMHTLIDATNPLNSRFLFNQVNGDIEDLYLYELYNLQSVIQLAVLSACETSVGKTDFSGSPNSLSNALVQSGIPATITSLWKVPDESTGDIMVAFYKYLKAGHRKDESLRLAKLDYLENTKALSQKRPIYWAGFIAVGNMEAVNFTNSNRWLWIAGILILLVILIFYVKKVTTR